MKKIVFPVLFFSFLSLSATGLGSFGDSLKYVNRLNALRSALRGNSQGFVELIEQSRDELSDIDFSKLTSRHIQNIISFTKSAFNNKNGGIKNATKSFIDELINKIKEGNNKNPELLNMLKELTRIGEDSNSSDVDTNKSREHRIPRLRM